MFEKEAEFYAREKYSPKTDIFIIAVADDAFKDSAEFGYNKANEWHYVSEKGLPKESGRYLVYVGGGENGVYPLDYDTEAKDFGYWCLDVGANLGVRDTIFETITERNEDEVIAWKEIVLPKESEKMAKRIGADDFKEVVLAILETDLDNEECAEIITFIADGYFERTDE